MEKRFAVLLGEIVDTVAIAEAPAERFPGEVWIDLTGMSPQPGPNWTYKNGVFTPPFPFPVSPTGDETVTKPLVGN